MTPSVTDINPPALLRGVSTLAGRYSTWLCDVWGVVHDGIAPFPRAVAAMRRWRAAGGRLILITNSPRLSADVVIQLEEIGVPEDAYDSVVSSGDVMRELLQRHKGARIFHLGPERDHGLIAALPVTTVELKEAEFVLCTGLIDDSKETPADYEKMLATALGRNLVLYCANPDKVVQRGSALIYCAGALAERYQEMGGTVIHTGKPHEAIYEVALAAVASDGRTPIDRRRVLCIGDGPETDIAGAALNGMDALFVVGGIHAGELARLRNDPVSARAAIREHLACSAPGVSLAGIVAELSW